MLTVYSIANFTAGIIFGGFTLLLYFGSSKRSTRAYTLVALSLALWAFAMGFYYLVSDYSLRLYLNRFNHYIGGVIGVAFLYFSLIFPEETAPRRIITRGLIVLETILAYFYLFTPYIIKDTFILRGTGLDRGWEFGSLGFLFHLNFFVTFLLGGYVLFKKIRTATEETKKNALIHILASTFLGSIIGVIVNIILPVFGIFRYSWLGPLFTLSWVILVSYNIVKYEVLNVRIILAEVLALALVTIVFINIFIPIEPSTLLISQLTYERPLVLNPYSAFIWLAATVIGSFSFLIYLGSVAYATRLYAMVGFAVTLWAVGMGAYYYTNIPTWLIFWNRYNHFAGSLIAASFYYFSYVYPYKEAKRKWVLPLVVSAQLVLFYLFFFTNLIIKDTYFTGPEVVSREWLFGSVSYLFYLNFFALFLTGFILLFFKYRNEQDPLIKKQLYYLSFGSLIGVIPSVITAIILPFFGNFTYYWISPILTLGWITFNAYAIARYQILSVRLILAEISVFVMSGILFANIFLGELAAGTISRIILFLTFAMVGSFFIRNIIKNAEQKDELTKLTGELKDLTENLQVKVEARTRELSKAKIHTETIIETLSDGLIEYSHGFKIIRVNKKLEELLGRDRSELIGQTLEPHKIVRQGYEFEITTVPMPSSQEKTGFISVVRDVTREKLIAKSKNEFISIAAHQLRTPLSIMKWTMNVLLSEDLGPLSHDQKKSLHRGYQTNEKMIDLVNDLLDVARIEEGRFGFKFEKGDIRDVLEQVVKESRDFASQKDISLTFHVPDDNLPELSFDRSHMSLALRNIVDNAINYTHPGGHVDIHASASRHRMKIQCIDNGIGIPLAQKDRVFAKFFRATNAVRMNTEGSGLGLFLVKSIIERHGGTVEVDSEENKGTTVTITLPTTAKKGRM